MAILDWIKEVPLSAVYKERLVDSEKQISALEKKVSMLETENIELKSRLSQCEENRRALEKQIEQKLIESHNSNPQGYICDHCGSKNLKPIGNKPNPNIRCCWSKRQHFFM